ncbi:MAG: hypothetical protein ACOCZK_00345 [Planctomycetota bacterium]
MEEKQASGSVNETLRRSAKAGRGRILWYGVAAVLFIAAVLTAVIGFGDHDLSPGVARILQAVAVFLGVMFIAVLLWAMLRPPQPQEGEVPR